MRNHCSLTYFQLFMKQHLFVIFLLGALIFQGMGCSAEKDESESPDDSQAYHLGTIAAMAEMVQAGVKPLALSEPLTAGEMDALFPEAKAIAERYDVELYREKDLLVTDLFPAEVAQGKEVLLLYRGTTLRAYRRLKKDKQSVESAGDYIGAPREAIARRFGRLLGYPPQTINRRLAENSGFRTMSDFGIRGSNLFWYYRDLERALRFYTQTLGLELVADYGTAKILRVGADAYLTLVDVRHGMHDAAEPKTVALALLTDQLAAWYEYLKAQKVPVKYEYKPRTGNAHDGFVAVDPEGYLLEFETFKQHPENERFIPLLDQMKMVPAATERPATVPPGLGFKGTVSWLYYRDVLAMQKFCEEVLGLELIVDQGWAKVYRLSGSGFIGLVDERRGMHQYTDEKAVNVSFLLDDVEGWFNYVLANKPFELRSDTLETGPEGKYRAFVGYDPEGYFLEFDRFERHPANKQLLDYLGR